MGLFPLRNKGSGGNMDFVMFLRAIAFNSLCAAIVIWMYYQGWIDQIVKYDAVYISRIIAGVGILGLTTITVRIFKISRELNIAKKYRKLAVSSRSEADTWLKSTNSRVAEFVDEYRRARSDDKLVLVDEFRMTVASKLFIFDSVTGWLTLLGLIGTVVGFQFAIDIIAHLKDIQLFVSYVQNISGALRIAIDTTIVGMCAALWLDVNLKWVLRPGAVQLVSEAIKIGVLYHE